jgi:hypothetical protein
MRALIALAVVAVAVAAVGCYHDKHGLVAPKREDYLLPPDQKRYNEPDTATWRAPPPPKQQDTLMNKGGPPIRGNGLGGF